MKHDTPSFGLYNAVFRAARNTKWVAAALFVLLAVQTERLQKARARQPLVITACGTTGEPPLIRKAEDLENPKTDRNGARNFVMHMVRYRLGWSSPTVLRDMQSYLAQCYHTQREKDLAYLEESVATGAGTMKRREQLVAQDVRNALTLPEFRDVDCEQNDEKVWFCMMDVAVVTQGLHEPYATLMPKYWLIKATLLPVDYTAETPWGVVLADFAMFPRKERET